MPTVGSAFKTAAIVLFFGGLSVGVSTTADAQDDPIDLLEGLGEEGPKESEDKKEVPSESKIDEATATSEAEEATEDASSTEAAETIEATETVSEPDKEAEEVEEPSRKQPKKRIDPTRLDKVKAVQRKPVLKRGRVELTPMISASINDAFFNHFATGATAIYYPHDNLGIGVSGSWFFANPRTDNVAVVRTSQTSVLATFDHPDWVGSVDVYWTPIYGKLSLFNRAILPFDIYFQAGLGMVSSGATRPAINWGVGQRLLLNDWMALRFEIKDHIYVDTQSVNGVPRSDIRNFLMVQIGVSFFVPPSFEYGR